MTVKEQDQVRQMLMKVKNVLSTGDRDIGSVKIKPHHIELLDNTPIWQKPRQFAKPVEDEIENQCQELLSNDIIEYSNSNWSSPCVPVRKPDGSLRLCIDYRKVNMVTRTEKFPMPNLNNCLYAAHNVKYFTKFDLVKGYYQVNLDDESRELTAFSTTKNHYQFKRLSFGLKNSGIAFQKMMQQILSPLKSSRIIVYIDDILIMSENFEEHLEMVEKVLYTLEKFQIKIKVKKCDFFKREVQFLGHVLSSEGISKSPEYVKKVKEFPKPITVSDLKKFLGLINFQRKFFDKCSIVVKPLTEITGRPEKEKIDWDENKEKAYTKILEEVEKDIKLTYPDYGENSSKLELYVDASGVGAGAVLMQKKNSEYKVIGYNSMCFSSSQQNYSTIERELTAIRWGCNAFKPFIYGIPFIIYTDHKPLIYMNNMAASNARIQRSLEDIGEYDFQIKYLPGSQNEAADFLSRMWNRDPLQNGDTTGLPKEFKVIQKIDGGGNSLFESLFVAMEYLSEHDDDELPENSVQMRKDIVSEMVNNMKKYNIPNNKHEKNKLKLMKMPDQLPNNAALLAASSLYKIEIRVYHNIKTPVIFNANPDVIQNRIINLQCIAYIHFNPLFAYKNIVTERGLRNVNTVYADTDDFFEAHEVDINCGEIYSEDPQSNCSHNLFNSDLIIRCNDVSLCALIDTGSQVSIIGEDTWSKIKDRYRHEEIENIKLLGIAGGSSNCNKVVNIQITIDDYEIPRTFPFCVVSEDSLPCCILLGINFLSEFDFNINFASRAMSINKDHQTTAKTRFNPDLNVTTIEVCSEEVQEVRQKTVKYMISDDDLISMQVADHALATLKEKIINSVPTKQWKESYLNQFKRHVKHLKMTDERLVRECNEFEANVITYPFLIEILMKTHKQLGHIGRHKLMDIVTRQFWHPAMDNVAREICRSCQYCQFNKVNIQFETPPTMKIKIDRPFELMSMDLVRFPISSKKNIAALVIIDHCSKWMTAVPVTNKSSISVAKSLKYKIIPNLLRVPENILSDNGLEFRGKETEEVLREFGIKHLYSSPYSPASNGGVERINRTLINLLKGLNSNTSKWDDFLTKAIIIYNNSYHSQLKCSPADYLLKMEHPQSNQIPVDSEVSENWREGHPNFKPFIEGQKVIKEVARIGDRAIYKLQPKYDGPYIVKKIQSNGLSYEIFKESDESVIYKCNHRKLRPFHTLPWHIQKHVPSEDFKKAEPIPDDETDVRISSSEYSFEGFQCIEGSDDSSISSAPKDPDKETHRSVTVNNNGKEIGIVPIDSLPCSEPCNYNIINSTIVGTTALNFDSFLLVEKLNLSLEEGFIELSANIDTVISQLNVAMMENDNMNILNVDNDSADFSGFSGVPDVANDKIKELKEIMESCRTTMNNSLMRRRRILDEISRRRKSGSFTAELSNLVIDSTNPENLPGGGSSTPRMILRSHTRIQ